MNFRPNNTVQLLRNGTEFFPALLAAIESAQHLIWIETYIFKADRTGERVLEALVAAAKRGVSARLLLDGFGSYGLPQPWLNWAENAGVQILFFHPERCRWSPRRQRLRRLHRKLSLVDGQTAFIGGINIIDDQSTPEEPARYDYAVRLVGPVVEDVAQAMLQLWQRAKQAQSIRSPLRKRPTLPRPSAIGNVCCALVKRDNLKHRRAIERAYLDAISVAKKEVLIANAYFFPGFRFRRALLKAAKRGVQVKLLLQGKRDHLLLQFACKGLYRQLLDAGIYIAEYHSGFMHAKVATVDRAWSTVGSSNIDPFSVLLAQEANVMIRDAAFVKMLRQDLLQRMENHATRVDHHTLKRWRWYYRALPWLAYQLVRVLIGVAGYGGREYRS